MRYSIPVLSILFALILTSCSGGGSSSGDLDQDDGTPTSDAVAIEGFNFEIKEGDYWEYQWDYLNTGIYSSVSDSGRIRLTLGASTLIQGVEAFPIHVSGRGITSDAEQNFFPIWKYVAISDNEILGGISATELKLAFDATNGSWHGGGFFISFSENTLIIAKEGYINNDYINEPAYVIGFTASEDNCFVNNGVVECGEGDSETYQIYDYFKPGVGPIGFSFYSGVTGDGWSASTRDDLGLVKSSLLGDVVSYNLEVEPNNSTNEATIFDLNRDMVGDLVESTDNASQDVVLSTTSEQLNNSSLGAQQILIPTQVTADINNFDSGETMTIPNLPGVGSYSVFVEDWYRFTVTEQEIHHIKLEFDYKGADLDFFVFKDEGSSYPYIGGSYDNNASTGGNIEEGTFSLTTGNYIIAVDYLPLIVTPRVNYTLNVDTDDNPNLVSVVDWYSITLNDTKSLSIQGTGGPVSGHTLVLTNDSGVLINHSTISSQSGSTLINTAPLGVGTYYLAIGSSAPTKDEYKISISQ